MTEIHIPASDSTPEINCDQGSGVLTLEGSSYPDSSQQFYDNPFKNILDIIRKIEGHFLIQFKVDYFNTSSAKSYVDFLLKVKKLKKDNLTIEWYYEKEDIEMIEVAESFQEITGLAIDVKEFK